MTVSADKTSVRVRRRFYAAAERVYDAFLDPQRAAKFMFATPAGQVVRCDIDGRVGGTFTIVDRRGGEDVIHTGRYVTLERPRLIVFTLLVEKYSSESSTVTIEISPRTRGCELTLAHELKGEETFDANHTEEGWVGILDVAAELLVDEAPTCGIGVAQHGAIPAKIAVMFEGLAETLELHRRLLVLDDPNAQKEDEVYRELAASWREIAQLTERAAARMTAQRELPMGTHDESAWGDEHVRAFETFVKGQSQALSLLKVAAERDESMLASIRKRV